MRAIPDRIRARCLRTLFALGVLVLVAAPALAGGASVPDLRSKLQDKQSQLQHAKSREGVLSTTIQRYGDRLDQLRGEVAALRNRQADVQAQLEQAQAELRRAKHQLAVLRVRLKRALTVLSQRLVAIYESDQPNTVAVLLNSRGFDDLLNRAEYLRQVQSQDTSIAQRVRTLRNQTRDTVERVRATRNEIAARQAELERTQAALQARQAEFVAARQKDQQTLAKVQGTQQHLEGDVSDIQGEIQAQLLAAQRARERAQAQAEAQAQSSAAPAQLAGPVQGESSSGFIWPVNGPVTSPFCEPRPWEACHPGIDISVPSGTPIHAAAAGTVAIAGPESGYGNYTCIDHGGGISTCYGHQETIEVSVGQHVSQGQVIGLSDCTGLCFGPHLHFEVRINGQVTDPMSYLP
jgi:murein DD-endopeptidase MepM/ murein hydrolase activator NlpD